MIRERLTRRGRIWFGHFYCGARRVQRSTRCTSREAAAAVVREWERLAADPVYRAAHQATLTSALERLLADRSLRGRAAGTLTMYRCKAGHLVRIFGEDARLAEIDAGAVDDYVTKRHGEGAALPTIAKELTTLRGALRLAKRRGDYFADLAAVMPVGLSAASTPRDRTVSPEELVLLLAELRPDRAAHVAFIVATGARWSESLRAERQDVDLPLGMVRIRGTKTAGAKRAIPIVAFAWALLRRVLEVRPGEGRLLRPWGNVGRELRDACARAKIAPVSPNDLRRTCATWLRGLGLEPSLIAVFLGHVDGRMVERVYGRLPADALAAAIRARLCELPPEKTGAT